MLPSDALKSDCVNTGTFYFHQLAQNIYRKLNSQESM